MYKPDQTDLRILKLLQQDGTMTYKEIGCQLGKAINSTKERIKKLKSEGYVESTVSLLNLQKLGGTFIAFPHINLVNHSEQTMTMFKEKMIEYPEVMECYHLTGHYDFMLKVILPAMTDYNKFLREKIGVLPYVGSIQSFLALSEVKRNTAYAFF